MLLTFNPVTRASSRRHAASLEQKSETLQRYAEAARLERRRAAKALRVRRVEGALYYFAEEVAEIEAGYRRGEKAGRAAVLALINGQYEAGYETGLDDGARCGRRSA